jgi:predicted transposase/invertase (TIGR01784 family)
MNIVDTKSDLAFKKVFGEKPHLLMSLLNSFLPLPNPIAEIQYLNPEIIPDKIDGKNSIVDVHCVDKHGRSFIVEMQVARQSGFTKRILMNTAKVYSRQLSKSGQYSLAQPVYSLNLLDHRLKPNENQWYHHYTFSNRNDNSDYMEEMQIILVELPKWRKLNKFDFSKTQDRWLMYFTQPTLFERLTPEEYARYSEICEALESLESKNLTPEQIRGYELYVDSIRQYHTTMSIEREEGWKDGLEKGLEQGLEQGREEGLGIGLESSLQIIEALKSNKLTPEDIAAEFNVDLKIVQKIQALI